MSATKPLAILLAVLVAATGVGAAVGSTHDTGAETYAMDAQLDDGTVTVTVTQNDSGVANATVEVDGEDVGETDANGTVAFERPDDEFEVNTETANAELESEYAVDDGSLVLEESEFEMEDDEREEEDEEREDEREDDEREEEDEEREDEREDDEREEEDEEREDERENDEREEEEEEREDERENDEREDDEREEEDDERENDEDTDGDAAAQQGPPETLPSVVPDSVTTIHDRISAFLGGNGGSVIGLGGAAAS